MLTSNELCFELRISLYQIRKATIALKKQGIEVGTKRGSMMFYSPEDVERIKAFYNQEAK
jgi:hypothetical protein